MTQIRRNNPALTFALRLEKGPLSDQEAVDLETWLAEHPDNVHKYRNALEMSEGLSGADDDAELQAGGDIYGAVQIQSGGWKQASLYLSSGFVLCALVLLVLWQSGASLNPDVELAYYETSIGETRTVDLSDGSALTLNTNSRVLVDVNDSRRHVVLDRGEAYFNISPDASRPFTVDSGTRSIVVLGTEFNVLLSADGLEVAVTEGTVEVHSRGSEAINYAFEEEKPEGVVEGEQLKAGRIGSFSHHFETPPTIVDRSVRSMASWRRGVLIFDDEPLVNVVEIINRYDIRDISVGNAKLTGIKVSGVFRVDDISASIDALETVLDIETIRRADSVVFIPHPADNAE